MDLPVLLFPQCAVSERDLKRGVAIFDPLEICQPWHLEAPAVGEELSRFVRFLRPPGDLRPKEDLKGLLAEYLIWGRQRQGKDVAAFLGASLKAHPSEGAKWEIRQRIRQMDRPPLPPDHALKWHMVLHLYEEIEKNRREAADMLQQLRRIRSPLNEALGESVETQGLFDDLPLEDAFQPSDEPRFRQVLDAWVHLFESDLKRSHALLTFDSRITAHLSETLAETRIGREEGPLSSLRVALPDFSVMPVEEILRAKSDASLACMTEELKSFVEGGEDSRPSADRIVSLSTELAQALPEASCPPRVRLSLLRAPSLAEFGRNPNAAILRGLAGKTVMLLEGEPLRG